MNPIETQLNWLTKHHLMFQINIIAIAFGILLFGSRIVLGLRNLPPNLYSIFGWRTTPTSDHVWIWIALIVFLLWQLRHYGFSLGKLSTTTSLIYALGDLMLVVGTISICWDVVSWMMFGTSLLGGAQYALIFAIGLYMSWGRTSLKQIAIVWLPQIPLYAFWVGIGFPVSLRIVNGLFVVTQYQWNPFVTGFEVLTWVIPCLLFIISKRAKP